MSRWLNLTCAEEQSRQLRLKGSAPDDEPEQQLAVSYRRNAALERAPSDIGVHDDGA
jgi:hypothetical protein